MKLTKLWQPLQIGGMTLKNRIVIPAMNLNGSEKGEMTDRIVEFYRRRAQGGAGLIVVGGVGVSRRGTAIPMMISIRDDGYIPGLKQLADAVHQEGGKICAQLYHAGGYSHSKATGVESVSSSAVYSKFTHETPRALTTEEVGEVGDIIAEAALRAVKAGFDAIELLSSAGYLVDQFLSPVKNLRTDKYGGETLEERLTFPLELIDKVKKKVGGKIVIGLRLSGDDFVENSNTYREKKIIAKAYEKAGVEYISVTGGWHETRVPQLPMSTPRAAFSYLAKEIKDVVSIPVFASNRINDPEIAEELLRDFYADAICFGRATIADPDLPNKIKNQETKFIRKCVGCNQGCFDAIFNLKEIRCTVNPIAMQELKFKKEKITQDMKNVLIIGGGPASMESAYRAHLLGHKVTLWEKSGKLGGQVNVAAVPHGRGELNSLITFYKTQFEALGINYALNKEANVTGIIETHADVVLFGTGVHFKIPPIQGIDGSQNCNICFADEALAGEVPLGKKVVVVGGAATGVETALWARKKGRMDPEIASYLAFYDALSPEEAMKRTYHGDREVFLLEYLPRIGNSIGKSTKWVFIDELKMLNVHTKASVTITEFRDNAVYFHGNLSLSGESGDSQCIEGVDTFILATGVESNRDLGEALKYYLKNHPELDYRPEMKYIGDARKVGTAQ